MANFRTVRGNVANKATDLDGRDNLYVHCVSKERLELFREGMSCVARTRNYAMNFQFYG
jgi:hypothetical protein